MNSPVSSIIQNGFGAERFQPGKKSLDSRRERWAGKALGSEKAQLAEANEHFEFPGNAARPSAAAIQQFFS